MWKKKKDNIISSFHGKVHRGKFKIQMRFQESNCMNLTASNANYLIDLEHFTVFQIHLEV